MPKICRNTQALLGLKCAVRCDPGDGKYLPVSETKPLVIGADEYLVARSDFDLPRASDIEGIRATQIEDDFFPRSKSHDDFPFLDAHNRRGRGGTIAPRGKGHDLSWFVALPISLLLIGPAKRLMDFEARSFCGEHAAFFQAFADRVSKPMILVPGKRHGQAAIQMASLIGQPQEVRRCLFQVVRLSLLDPIYSIQSSKP